MNSRSLRFQLTVWYACLLTGCFLLLGTTAFFLLKSSLEGELREQQIRRVGQIAQIFQEVVERKGRDKVSEEIESRFAPAANNRWLRIIRNNGQVVYFSAAPKNESFDPTEVPSDTWPIQSLSWRRVELPNGHRMMLASQLIHVKDGSRYWIETGVQMDDVQADLRQWTKFLVSALPLVLLVGVGGGYWLVHRALRPVDQITATAQRITSQNLSKRLPVAHTGDELERLSVALNHMIEHLDEAFQHSRRFMADASHELRTPLTIIKGELETLVQEPNLGISHYQRINSTLEEVERLARIVEGLFAISRLDAGEAQVEWVCFDLAQLAAATTEQMQLLAEDKKIQIECCANESVWVEGDRFRLKQVVVNLLDNAIKFTPEGGKIEVKVEASHEHAVLEVNNTGPSIPAEALPNLFDRFYRVDKGRSRDLGGAGLGLAIVKSICTFHHGRVSAASHPEKGNSFRVELPLVSRPVERHVHQAVEEKDRPAHV